MLLAKLLSLLSAIWTAWVVAGFSTNVTVDNHVLTSVNDKSASEVRIYANEEVTSIADGAFDDCSFSSIMISYTVREVNATFPDNIVINYTKSFDDIAFEIPANAVVNEYACDEGFLMFWGEYIRPQIDGTICNVEKANYQKMKLLYSHLSDYDKEVVENTNDGDGKILNSIKFLDKTFSNSSGSQNKEKEIPQTVMLTLILAISSFGMTSIGVFYLLKDKKYIK